MANEIINTFRKGAGALGMSFGGEPAYVEVPSDKDLGLPKDQLRNGGNFAHCVKNDLKGRNFKIVVVLIPRDKDKAIVKRTLDSMGLASQFLLQSTIRSKLDKMGVITNIIRQINAKTEHDLYQLQPPAKMN
mmetsp:Transcript_12168/g.18806  ORF Transcript_12168/g.18806 Transcript_12168/m.18806 type:complete len:132 (+) Transcript_12168:1504-1899(+)